MQAEKRFFNCKKRGFAQTEEEGSQKKKKGKDRRKKFCTKKGNN